jgi:hypothetical protein
MFTGTSIKFSVLEQVGLVQYLLMILHHDTKSI